MSKPLDVHVNELLGVPVPSTYSLQYFVYLNISYSTPLETVGSFISEVLRDW